jgi:hypothetical protein
VDWEELRDFVNIRLGPEELLQLFHSAFRVRVTLDVGVYGLMKVFYRGIFHGEIKCACVR